MMNRHAKKRAVQIMMNRQATRPIVEGVEGYYHNGEWVEEEFNATPAKGEKSPGRFHFMTEFVRGCINDREQGRMMYCSSCPGYHEPKQCDLDWAHWV